MITNEPNLHYIANESRYKSMQYSRCGNSGLILPKLSLGLWQNFGEVDSLLNAKELLFTAFNHGITHFDLANNYGPPYGSAESTFGTVLKKYLNGYRDELIISSKAGYDMWPGPYGIGGSRKHLISSCDQSLQRTGLEYFDIFYHHCMDNETPIEETMQALAHIVKTGKALYIGLSNYQPAQTEQAIKLLKDSGTPLVIHQPKYNIFDRSIENGLTELLLNEHVGSIVYSPLAQGLLTDKYLAGIPSDSRASKSESIYLNESDITQSKLDKVHSLNELAASRNQSLAQMAIAWTLNNKAVTTCLIGASKKEQIIDSIKALDNLNFSKDELILIDKISKN